LPNAVPRLFSGSSLPLVTWLALTACSPNLGGTGPDGDTATDASIDTAMGGPPHDAGAPTAPPPDARMDAGKGVEDDAGSVVTEDAATPPDAVAPSDGSSSPPADGGSDASHDGSMDDDDCDIPGRYAVDLRLEVTWNDTTLAGIVPLLRRGTGEIRIQTVVDVAGPLEQATGTLRTCSAKLPDFATENLLVSEHYSAYFPDSVWDSPSMPSYPVALRYACAKPGCELVVEQVVASYGASVTSPWPERSEGTAALTLVDHDGDGYPGVSVLTRGPGELDAFGQPYSQLPVSWTLNARAPKIGVPLRVNIALSGKQVQCGLFTGRVGQANVDARAVACRAVPGNGSAELDCNDNQVQFLDQNFPAWTVVGGRFQAVRVAASTTCADVRAMF
jgi:hypothetical protein